MMSEKAKAFIGRLGPGASPELAQDIETAFGISTNFKLKASKIRANPGLTPVGHGIEIARELSRGPIDHLNQLRGNVTRKLETLHTNRAKLVPQPDRSDLFAEMQRQEARTLLRSLPIGARARAALESTDPIMREAVAFASPEFSGLTAEIHKHVVDALIEARHGEQLGHMRQVEEALETARAGLQLAADDLRRESGLSEADFAQLVAQSAAPIAEAAE